MRRSVGVFLGMCLALSGVGSSTVEAGGAAPGGDAQEAVQEITAARERANAAAEALFDTEAEIDDLEIEAQALQEEVADLEAQVDTLRVKVEGVAVDRFTRAGSTTIPLLTGFEQAGQIAQVDVLIDVVNDSTADTFDQFDAVSLELAAKQQALAENQAATTAAREEFERLRQTALAEVARLKEVEADRLQDEAVQAALEAQQAESARQAQAQRDAEAASTARAEATQAAKSSSSRPTVSSEPLGGGEGEVHGDAGDAELTAGGSGGAGGGRTGNNGLGGRSGALDPLADYGFDGWLCPVMGPVSFADTYGAPRSGGRLHQGVDMIGEQGLPLVAVVDGFVQQKTNLLGGNVVWLTGTDGNKYYYAHIAEWAASGAVTAGTVIAYLGQSGNAVFSVPHLHFEIHPGGGAAVNPYPTVRAHC